MLPTRRWSTYPPPAPGLLSSLNMASVFDCFRRRFVADQVLTVELDQEVDGRFIAEIPDLPGVMTYGQTRDEALQKAAALAFRVFADRLESDEVRAKSDMTFQLHTRECLVSR